MSWGRQSEQRTSLNNPSVPISSDSIVALLGSGLTTDAGVNVSEFTAMRVAAVWRCVSLIAGTIAQLPLRTYVAQGSSRVEVGNELLTNPYPGMTRYEFWETILTHQLLWGNAYALKVPNGLNETVRLMPLWPWTVAPQRKLDSLNRPIGDKQYVVSGASDVLTDDEIIHFPGLSYDGIKGLAPISHARQSLGLSIAAEEFGSRLFGSGSLMGGVLSTPQKLDQTQADALKLRWRERVTGLARAHEVAVLDMGTTFTPISIPPDDAQFLQTRQFSVVEIARWFGVPPHLLEELDKTSSWGAGVAEQSLGFVRYTLSFWIARNEQRITQGLLPPGHNAEFDTQALLRGDTAARWSAYATGIGAGWLKKSEARQFENLPPIDGIDDEPVSPLPPPPVPGIPPDTGKEPKGV